MKKTGPSIISFISVFVLVSCQSGGGSMPECVNGFVKVDNICRSLGSLSSEELSIAKIRLADKVRQNEDSSENQAAAQQMIQKIQETEAVTRLRQQMSERNAQDRRERNKAPVQHLQEKTVPESVGVSALRKELRDSFKNEFRSKLRSGSN